MAHSHITNAIVRRLFQFLFCLGTLFLCLFLAMVLTLWSAPYLVFWADRTGYPDALSQGMRTSCAAYAAAYGLPEKALLECWDTELLRQELVRSVDETFHEMKPGRSSPFDSLSEEGAFASSDPEKVSAVCRELSSLWHKAVQTPFSNLLNLLMQYYRIAPGLVCLFLALSLGSLAMLYSISTSLRALAASLLPAAQSILLCGLLIPAAAALFWSRWSWVPAESLARPLFHWWSAGFFLCWALLTLAAGFCFLVVGSRWNQTSSPLRPAKIRRRAG